MNDNITNKSRRGFVGALGLTTASFSMTKITDLNASPSTKKSIKATKHSSRTKAVFIPPFAVRVLNKAGFGPKQGDIDAFNALGIDDNERLFAWVDNQINPTSFDPDLNDRLDSLTEDGYTTINKTRQQLWEEHRMNGIFYTRRLPFYEMSYLIVLRSIYSQWQLRELLNDFWFNHFNVKGGEGPSESMLPLYDRNIRTHIFGNFYDMLLENAKSPDMLYYLDNHKNTWPNPNENYARELMELHTLGAIENSYETIEPQDVGNNIKGQRKGYTETDVRQFARALTGWTYDFHRPNHTATGAFEFLQEFHYSEHAIEPIMVMDITLNENGGENDVTTILKYLADHYGTARFIVSKLCKRLVSDNPSESLIASTAEIFYQKRDDADQLAEVYRHILLSNEFKTAWSEKIKRPLETIVACARAADADIDFRHNHYASGRLITFIEKAGQAPYGVSPPTGYSDEKPKWSATTPLLASWQGISFFCSWSNAIDNTSGTPKPFYCNLPLQSHEMIPDTENRTPINLVDTWMMRLKGYHYEESTRQKLINYVTQKANVAEDETLHNVMDTNDLSNNNYPFALITTTLVSLILMSPDSMRR